MASSSRVPSPQSCPLVLSSFGESVVFLQFRPKNSNLIVQLLDHVYPISPAQHEERVDSSRDIQCSTGLVVKDKGAYVYVLTCAHVLGYVFNNSNPINPKRVHEMYKVSLMCEHHEVNFRNKAVGEMEFIEGEVVFVDGPKDLMLLGFSKKKFVKYCNSSHRPISFGSRVPEPLQKLVMISWPYNGHRTVVTGNWSNASRPVDEVSDQNICQFDLHVSEVDITSDIGSSGAPLLNGNGEFVGLLHGGSRTLSFREFLGPQEYIV